MRVKVQSRRRKSPSKVIPKNQLAKPQLQPKIKKLLQINKRAKNRLRVVARARKSRRAARMKAMKVRHPRKKDKLLWKRLLHLRILKRRLWRKRHKKAAVRKNHLKKNPVSKNKAPRNQFKRPKKLLRRKIRLIAVLKKNHRAKKSQEIKWIKHNPWKSRFWNLCRLIRALLICPSCKKSWTWSRKNLTTM